jgi:hypothetical protein
MWGDVEWAGGLGATSLIGPDSNDFGLALVGLGQVVPTIGTEENM